MMIKIEIDIDSYPDDRNACLVANGHIINLLYEVQRRCRNTGHGCEIRSAKMDTSVIFPEGLTMEGSIMQKGEKK